MNHFLLSILDYEGRELKGVYNLACCWLESRNEPLPVVNTGLRGKGTKRCV